MRTASCSSSRDSTGIGPGLRGAWREQPEPGSGILFDLGSHLVDQAVTLFGAPDAVTGDVRIERDDAVVDDAFDVTLHYPAHRVVLRSTMLATAPGPRFVVQGTAGSYVKYHLDPQEARLAVGDPANRFWEQEPRERWGTLSRATGGGVESETLPTEAGDYRLYYANVRDAIRGTAPLASHGRSGARRDPAAGIGNGEQQAAAGRWTLPLSGHSEGHLARGRRGAEDRSCPIRVP